MNRIANLLIAVSLISSVPAWAAFPKSHAAHATKKKPVLETYSAVEGDVTEPAKPALPEAAARPAPAAPAAAPAPKTEVGEFDAVPSDQTDSIAHRLKLVERLIREHGRAYDYRSHTNRQLEAILIQLTAPSDTVGAPQLKAPKLDPEMEASDSGSS